LRGEVVGTIDDTQLEVQPGQTFSVTLMGYITNAAASQQSLNVLIRLDTPYGTFEKGVPISAKTP
jgi:hypothetical protein